MAPLTPFYTDMKSSLADARKLVDGVNPHECKTDLQNLKLQGYILISHSIFEEYIEKLGNYAAEKAKKQLVEEENITRALVALISTSVVDKISDTARKKISAQLSSNLNLFALEAVNSYFKIVKKNHGITSGDQKSLFLPIGIDIESLDMPLSQNLNAFGRTRGSVAHSFKLQRENTLSDIQSRIDNIVINLETLDREACKVCC